ncbi:Pyranose 2-oxidase [Fusarium sp. Ph1]|nr:Pyranose 2-oxidase [Fusarium sp. Ph1]
MSPEVPQSTGSNPDTPLIKTEVLIVGSGPIGAVFARTLVDNKKKVLMIDIGEQETRRVGDHKKNSMAVQKDISLFTNTVKGELNLLSVPTNTTDVVLEPSSWAPKADQLAFIKNGQNPDQKPFENLSAAAASRVVGGMGSHWTCCTPRENPIERSDLFSNEEWDGLYDRAEKLFDTTETAFDKSIRQQLVKKTLEKSFEGREMRSMPLACKRSEKNQNYVEWSATATILGDLSDPKNQNPLFEIKPNTQCLGLALGPTKQVEMAVVRDILTDKQYYIKAKKYIICAGAVLTPGILFNSSEFGNYDLADSLPALGRYMTEQPMAFCQVVLNRNLVDNVEKDPYHLGWDKYVKIHRKRHPNDPLPFPFNDPDPQCYFPLSEKYPWHTQIHRDAFGYGQVPPTVDQRLIVDLRWFTYMEPKESNYVEFSKTYQDQFRMPQPTFHFSLDQAALDRCEGMITDMVDVARKLGGFLPGAEPKYLAPGSALHICGTYRAGESDEDSVVDRFGKVWHQDNLVLGGCGVIPTANACNPTLTAACFALAAADKIVEELGAAQ